MHARPTLNLFLISWLILFLELACIRWFPAHVLFLTFFTNTVLLASFIGMSIGCLLAERPGRLIDRTPFWLAISLLAGMGVQLLRSQSRAVRRRRGAGEPGRGLLRRGAELDEAGRVPRAGGTGDGGLLPAQRAGHGRAGSGDGAGVQSRAEPDASLRLEPARQPRRASCRSRPARSCNCRRSSGSASRPGAGVLPVAADRSPACGSTRRRQPGGLDAVRLPRAHPAGDAADLGRGREHERPA